MDVRFAGSDRENIYVQTPAGARPIPKSDVVDVDHPGDGATGVGAAFAGYGILNIAVGMEKCQDTQTDNREAFCAGVFAPAVLGLSMMAWGFATHMNSEHALANRVHRETGGLRIVPISIGNDASRGHGIGVGTTW